MAEKLRLRVKCHACGYEMQGTAKYGSGQYSPDGHDFEFIAVGKYKDSSGRNRVKGEVFIQCPQCEVRNKFEI